MSLSLGTAIASGLLSARPASGTSDGELYFATDHGVFRWSAGGSAWVDVTAVLVSAILGLGTGVATFLATPSSANLASALTDETGSGAAVFATSPTLVTPALGTPASGTLTNCTGLPESGVTNLTTDLAAKAPLASPTFTGTPAAPTPSTADNSTKLATTAYVQAQGYGTGSGTVTHTGSLTANQPVFGNGSADTTIGTKSGNTTEVMSASGSFTSGNLLKSDASGNAIDAGLTESGAASGVIGMTIDGGGSSPATGSHGFVQVPYAGTITSWTILGDVSGSCQITVKKSTYSGFPTTSSIVASAQPAASSAQKATSSTLTGWTTSFSAGDVFEFNLDSVTTMTRIIIELQVTKS